MRRTSETQAGVGRVRGAVRPRRDGAAAQAIVTGIAAILACHSFGPVDPVRDEAVGPAGPTTSTRMDKFTDMMLQQTGLLAMVGKAERGPAAIDSIRRHKAAYLMAVGGAAYLVSKAIRKARVVGFADLGMEAIYEFEVKDMPVTVAVDAQGTSVHETGPKEWQARIAAIPVTIA